MSSPTISKPTRPADGLRHEALLYAGEDDFVARVGRFVVDGVARDEPVLVLVDSHKVGLLRDALGRDAASVAFADMTDVGHNPARIIPAWEAFVRGSAARGGRARGVGEPVWPGRSSDELAECHVHESLINLAFADAQMWLVCPYDTATLPPSTVEDALLTHPHVTIDDRAFVNGGYQAGFVPGPLTAPPPDAARFAYDLAALRPLREFVAGWAAGAGLDVRMQETLVFVANELATNSIRHGGGRGNLVLWRSGACVTCEVSDRGWIRDPLVGRVAPTEHWTGGRGVWLSNQLCDLVQIRSTPDGTSVRVHLSE